MWAKQRNTSGFTIVELLIVIVVIAILAAITIVAYNGIQQRAKNAQVVSGVNAYVKAIESFKAVNNSYPSLSGCLGANYPSDQCWTINGVANRVVNSSLDSQLSEFIPNKPTLATSLLEMGTGYTGLQRAGLVYVYNSSTNIELRYYLAGNNQSCSIDGFAFANEGNLSRCIKVISN